MNRFILVTMLNKTSATLHSQPDHGIGKVSNEINSVTAWANRGPSLDWNPRALP